MSDYDNITIDEIRQEIRKFNNDESVSKLENYYHSKSLPEIIGVSRKELAHSGFLAWILNDLESHLLGKFPIKKLLELLVTYSKEKQQSFNKDLFDSIIISDYLIDNTILETERSIKGVGRLDIYFEGDITYLERTRKLRLIIENKVGTKEHSDQTIKYYNHYEKIKDANDIIIYVYLTAMSSLDLMDLELPECSCKEYIQINYQSVVDFILEPALNKNITEKTKFIIREYLQSLSQPTINKEDDEYKQGMIMALGADERNLLTKFWDKNQKIILASLYAISSDPEQEKDTRDSANQALNNLSSKSKDRSLCSIKYNNIVEVEKIRKSDIGYQTVKLLERYKLIDIDTVKFLKADKTASHNLLKTIDEVTTSEEQYRRFRVNSEPELIFDGIEYYVVRNWGVGNIGTFIDKMKVRFPGLDYEIH